MPNVNQDQEDPGIPEAPLWPSVLTFLVTMASLALGTLYAQGQALG